MTTVNLDQAARALDVSIPTVKAWARQGMPVIKRGTNGLPWELDLDAITTWRDARSTRSSRRRQARSEELQKFSEGLGVAPDLVNGALSLDDRLKATKLANERLKLAAAMGEVLPASEVRQVWAEVMTEARSALMGLPDQLAKFGEMSREQRALIDQTIRSALIRLADGVKGFDVPRDGADPDGERGAGRGKPVRPTAAT